MDKDVNLTVKQVSERLQCDEKTLYRQRRKGEGPPWFRHGGKILYPRAELEAYERALLPFSYLESCDIRK